MSRFIDIANNRLKSLRASGKQFYGPHVGPGWGGGCVCHRVCDSPVHCSLVGEVTGG